MRNFSSISTGGSCCLRWIFLLLGVVLFIEVMIFNLLIVYIYHHVNAGLLSLADSSEGIISKLLVNDRINSFLFNARAEGVFTSLLQDTIERIYISHERQAGDKSVVRDKEGRRLKDISFIGLDVSHSSEATYIYQRIRSRKTFPYHFFIVDIGANDGFLSSNSFNFIQWGWDAVLVDPQTTEMMAAKKILRR